MSTATLKIESPSVKSVEAPTTDVLLRDLFDGVYYVDRERTILHWNPACEEISGYSAPDVIGKRCNGGMLDHVDSAGNHLCENGCPLVAVMNTGNRATATAYLKHKDGRRIAVELNVSPILDQDGEIIGAVEAYRDISERKEAEQQLESAYMKLEEANVKLQEADRLKSIFLASMSHELRTPLNSIIGFTSIIADGLSGEINDRQCDQLGLVKSNAQHLLGLINDVLDISKIEADKIELMPDKFLLDDLMKEVVDSFLPMTSRKRLNLTRNSLPDIEMYNDRRRTKQVLTNLISNAVKFTEEGSISVTASIIRDNILQVRVADTGAGMTEEAMSRLFQPFQQVDANLTKSKEGTGLGLYLSQKLARLMGGSITVESKYGKGSEFTFNMQLSIDGCAQE